ncbi:uncharacterized protein LOC124596503 [Schistocerca americana]|uniref:uncharacterized protein LOC124596503 n=1 Tax=Schistocerca americana TaxID=7009 RepID=UPI001F4F5F6B|nr:uncharacterized protein LOC124596503 [Schistocerca americana]
MALFVFWTSAFVLCVQPLISCAKGTVETALIDPFDMGRIDASKDQETKEWVDPFDMTCYSHGERKMVKERSKTCKNCPSERNGMEKNFLQRLVNLLINHCQNGAVEDTSLLVTVTHDQLRELYRLKEAADSEATVRVLNGIFSYMTVHEKSSFLADIFISDEVWSNIAAMSFALLPVCVFLMGGTMRRIVLILALSIFAVSYFKTQKLLLKKLELQNERILMKQTQCSPRRRAWFNLFGSDNEAECLKQLHAQKIDPSLEVTPIQVVSHMTAVGLLQPMEHFSIMFSRFSNQIFESHSMLYGLFVFVIAVFVVIYVITIFCAGIFGRNFSVGNKHISLGMKGSAEPHTERMPAVLEPAAQNQVVGKPNTEIAVINRGHSPQPVIQIIHNYPIKHVDEPVVGIDCQIKQAASEKNINNSELKSVDSVEEAHKISEITLGSSSIKGETSKTCESQDKEK